MRWLAAVLSFILLSLVLYLPSVHRSDRFLQNMAWDYQDTYKTWGDSTTRIITQRFWRLQQWLNQSTPIPRSHQEGLKAVTGPAAAREMAAANRRLFESHYFRSLDALVTQASFRISIGVEWVYFLLLPAMAWLLDGWLMRKQRAKTFALHNPELFAIAALGAVLLLGTLLLLLILPQPYTGVWFSYLIIGQWILISYAVRHYPHRS